MTCFTKPNIPLQVFDVRKDAPFICLIFLFVVITMLVMTWYPLTVLASYTESGCQFCSSCFTLILWPCKRCKFIDIHTDCFLIVMLSLAFEKFLASMLYLRFFCIGSRVLLAEGTVNIAMSSTADCLVTFCCYTIWNINYEMPCVPT